MEYLSNKYSQSAVIPYKFINGTLQILLIKSRSGKWIIPKGIIEDGLTPQESARREAIEEAGVNGKVSDKLFGEYQYEKWGGICIVKIFAMNVEEEYEIWQEDYFRIRKWFLIDKAITKVSERKISEILENLEKELSN
ncbi:MAG: NUDIX hydrolase [Ignavibacteria bacterium]|nr:NUDIX hydrolase [Ignavibacteria bacterium]